MATHIEYTPSSSPTGIQQTISFWIKRSELHTDQCVFEARQNGTNLSSVKFNTNDELQIYSENGGTTNVYLKTTRRFRDTNAWWHIVYAIDTSQGTAADRIKMYVNGVQETAFSSSTYPSQNYDNFWFGIQQKQVIGIDNQGNGSEDFQGLLTHFHYSRGYVYQASTFGSTDSTTGEWKINASPSGVNYGATGYFILKNGNSVTDQSGNSNNFTVGSGTLTKTEDNPSNNFCTLNPLLNRITGYASGNATSLDLQNGNTFGGKVTHGAYFGTMGVSTGKWYWEVKVQDTNQLIGIAPMRPNGGVTYFYDDTTVQGYYPYGNNVYTNGVSASGGPYDNTSNKIYSFALDATNNKLWVGRDGTFTGDPVAGSGATWASLPTENTNKEEIFWTPLAHSMSTSQNNNCYFNFGNGYFGTTAVSSAGTNASNNGIFEYDVPTGFTALSTKGLNE